MGEETGNLTPYQISEGARRIMSDPAFLAAVEEIDSGIIQEWRTANTVEEREAAFAQQEALRRVLVQLRTLISRT